MQQSFLRDTLKILKSIPLRLKYLLWTGLFSLTLLLTTMDKMTAATFSPREFRGVWVASVHNIDWPSQRGLPVAQQKTELLNILNRMQELNLNALVLQVRPNGDAFYNSSNEPWSGWLTGKQGTPPQPYYDPLAFAIAESHKRNIELHAWFNPYRAQIGNKDGSFASNHMAVKYPQYAYPYGNTVWMDPGAKVIQDQTFNTIMDVVRRYDIDAIHFDDYFYPYPQKDVDFPDAQTYSAYQVSGGTLSLSDWRRQNVNDLVERLYQSIHAEKPYVKFGISPFGIYRPGDPPEIKGFDQYEGLYADVKLWLEKGWVDYLVPQLYWRIDPPAQSYPVLLNWWLQNNPQQRHIYAGNALYKLSQPDWSVSELVRQVKISRQPESESPQPANQFSLGNIFFSMKAFRDNVKGINDVFKSSVYPTPALPPAMPWLDDQPPAPPTGVQVNSGVISWFPDNSGDVRSWALYRQTGNQWGLVQVLNSATTTAKVPSGTYALRAVDRLANESVEEVVTVQ
ncbi:MAG: family 10 glycosylhydrolase [Symploca sp. SIO2E6]|nr:family 10 glycosylhydrolase [Symploca sp. SIO2E6]